MACIMGWGRYVIQPGDVADKAVLEVGSQNVNGTFRDFIEPMGPDSYTATDAYPGDGVEFVVPAEQLVTEYGVNRFDTVVSTEMLEHCEHWQAAVWNMMAVTKPGGLLVVTTRSPGFGWHDYPSDHWRFTVADFRLIFDSFVVENLEPDPCHPGVNIACRKPTNWNGTGAFVDLAQMEVAPPP